MKCRPTIEAGLCWMKRARDRIPFQQPLTKEWCIKGRPLMGIRFHIQKRQQGSCPVRSLFRQSKMGWTYRPLIRPYGDPTGRILVNKIQHSWCIIDFRSPFRTSAGGYNNSGRPPLPTRCSSADRSSSGSLISMQRSTSVERSLMMAAVNSKPPTAPTPPHSNSVHVIGFHNNESKDTSKTSLSPTHYAVPKAASTAASANKVRIQLVPDFHKGKHDMGEFTYLYYCVQSGKLQFDNFSPCAYHLISVCVS